MLAAENAKYQTSYGPEMVDPALNSVYALRLDWVFALDASDFAGSPTRFTFGPPGRLMGAVGGPPVGGAGHVLGYLGRAGSASGSRREAR